MKVVILQQATESLKRSIHHLKPHYDKRYLVALQLAIKEKIRWLADNPGAGQFEPELDWTNRSYRRVVVKDFKIVHRIDGDVIVVNDIFDSRQDPKKMKG